MTSLIPNTFAIKAQCKQVLTVSNDYFDKAFKESFVFDLPYLIIGCGSNILFVDDAFLGQVIISDNQKVEITTESDYYSVKLGAAVNWHEMVKHCVELGINGLENLALIPGTVGAAPVQNIGAYGVEFSDFCEQVEVIELATQNRINLSHQDCQFGYRDSIFKHQYRHHFLINSVTLRLPKKWQANLTYGPLQSLLHSEYASSQGTVNQSSVNQSSLNLSASNKTTSNSNNPISAKLIFDKVCQIRQSKLPDPALLPNAGSFFKNPVISQKQADAIKLKEASLPIYPQADGKVKIAAGYLIEQVGLKGFKLGAVGVHQNQALVLVNYGQGTGQDIVTLANTIRQAVFKRYHIWLEPEVRFITKQGEVDATAYLNEKLKE